uniref:Ig-like domain-containing protein n=1 Tax=Seriola lalandi dorsalis TaxID=1841481 RepID=A0A3B4Y9U2_SERLL
MTEENTDDKPQAFTENPSGVPSDEGASQTVKHKFTFSFDVVGEAPHVISELENITCSEDNTAVLECVITGEPAAEVEWYCNDIRLELTGGKYRVEVDDKVYRLYINNGDTISLTIHNVTKADQGEYICEAVNYVGEARSVALVVVVSQEVRFMPAPPAVTHQHVMEFDVEEDDSSRSPSPQEILLEVELDENEEGAVDFVTQEHDELKIAFEVTEMPPRFINPICDMEAPEGTTVMFECSLMGIPSPIVSWFKGDKKVPHNNKKYLHSSDGDNHFLKICKVSTQDSGVYTCRAINVVGETLCRASVIFELFRIELVSYYFCLSNPR